MYPLLHPGALVLVDESKRKIVTGTWQTEFERPIYFLEHRGGWLCSWCSPGSDGSVIVQAHPASGQSPVVYRANELEIIGQVTGVAMLFGRRARA
jgi:hypothetical protein